MQCRRTSRRSGLHARGGDTPEAEVIRDRSGDVTFTREFLGVHHPHIHSIDRFSPRALDCHFGRFGHELWQRFIPFAKGGHANTRHKDLHHDLAPLLQ
jgi:hypothetical protein